MHEVQPRVFLIGRTEVIEEGVQEYLDYIGASDWKTDAEGPEKVIEVMARGCYRSFGTDLNPNITRVREGIGPYLKNIMRVGHGSVTEHAYWNFIFAGVSRVFTHELVRHRVGTAMSQESLRFVRLEDLGMWAPTCIRESPEAMEIFSETFEHLEDLQVKLAKLFKLDEEGVDFAKKKMITSAMRRIAPIGLATSIGWTGNIRTLRHVIEMRTSRHAEEEIRIIFDQVAKVMRVQAPNAFADYSREEFDGIGEWTTDFKKV